MIFFFSIDLNPLMGICGLLGISRLLLSKYIKRHQSWMMIGKISPLLPYISEFLTKKRTRYTKEKKKYTSKVKSSQRCGTI